jgi:PhnO protein
MECLREAMFNDEDQIYRLVAVLDGTKIDPIKFSDVFNANRSNPFIFYYVYEKEDVILGFISIHVQKLLHHASSIAEILSVTRDDK